MHQTRHCPECLHQPHATSQASKSDGAIYLNYRSLAWGFPVGSPPFLGLCYLFCRIREHLGTTVTTQSSLITRTAFAARSMQWAATPIPIIRAGELRAGDQEAVISPRLSTELQGQVQGLEGHMLLRGRNSM